MDVAPWGVENFELTVVAFHRETGTAHQVLLVLLRYYDFFLLYGDLDFNIEGFAKIISKEPKSVFLSGKKELVQKFEDLVSLKLEKNREL